ncbi:hypothetical protein TGAM01_v210609 [Trichoderma gamsii]|uniref:Uncharacterized protein n=1 Tax=Trichoderma gamsii TaxID=398673 RepID=A0A2P4Z885_9HYPO|nr:hypothetical protein TGAM01_v210609 [Trichoderma gamsii]PON20507.1 hypothetical protein TGAM01_v210609 [Trichoderma gamsii]
MSPAELRALNRRGKAKTTNGRAQYDGDEIKHTTDEMLQTLDGKTSSRPFHTVVFLAFCCRHWPPASLPNAFHLLSHDSPLASALRPLCVWLAAEANARAGRYGEQKAKLRCIHSQGVSVSMPAAARPHSVVSQKGLRLSPTPSSN